MKKWSCLILALVLMIGALFSCNKITDSGKESDSNPDSGVQSESTTTPATERNDSNLKELTINGKALSDYTIVYAKSEYDALSVNLKVKITEENDFDRLTAERLAALFYEKFGVKPEVRQDAQNAEADAEILIGKTNRGLYDTELSVDSYQFELREGRLVICGGAYGTTWHAVDAMEKWIAKKDQSGATSADFTSADSLNGTYHLNAVACIGDSITAGFAASDPILSYPACMQRVLWRDYLVFNYGVSATTMRDDINPYRRTTAWQNLLQNPIQYDLVLIMLGTNDSGRDAEWSQNDDYNYQSNFQTLVRQVEKHSPQAQYVLMNCPTCFTPGTTYGSEHMLKLQKETAKWLYEQGVAISFFNMNQYTAKEMGSSLFPDTIHPSDAGYAKMGQEVAALSEAVMSGDIIEYMESLD